MYPKATFGQPSTTVMIGEQEVFENYKTCVLLFPFRIPEATRNLLPRAWQRGDEMLGTRIQQLILFNPLSTQANEKPL